MAAALLAYEPLQQLQHENFRLREESRQARAEVQALLAWKDKAVKHMTTLAPARRKAAREVERAKQLQQQLRAVESSLKTRSALEDAAVALEAERESLRVRVAALERENAALRIQTEHSQSRADEAESQLAALGEGFRLHLEQLVAIRERLETDDGSDASAESPLAVETASSAGGELQEEGGEEREEGVTPSNGVDSAALVAGLDAVSAKCLGWLQEHLAQSFALQQRKAAVYEAQHAELQTLRAQLAAAERLPEQQAEQQAQLERELARQRDTHEVLKQQAAAAERLASEQCQRREETAARLRLVVGEVRQYLRLVRGEIKRKFGYLPEAIAHAESWARIAEALETLLRQSAGRGGGRGGCTRKTEGCPE